MSPGNAPELTQERGALVSARPACPHSTRGRVDGQHLARSDRSDSPSAHIAQSAEPLRRLPDKDAARLLRCGGCAQFGERRLGRGFGFWRRLRILRELFQFWNGARGNGGLAEIAEFFRSNRLEID
jgi:hypothetical protein